MKQILALNAFDINNTSDLGAGLQERVQRRTSLFGAASAGG